MQLKLANLLHQITMPRIFEITRFAREVQEAGRSNTTTYDKYSQFMREKCLIPVCYEGADASEYCTKHQEYAVRAESLIGHG